MTTTTCTTDRQQFRETVALVAAKAKAILPQETNGRVESAIRLVLLDEVQPQADGTVEVGSTADPRQVYHLAGTTCDCKDFVEGRAPEGWCKHRISAGIFKRVRELLPPAVESTPEPLPEAPASVNVRLQVAGREVQWTLRDTDEARLAVRLEALLQRYPVPQASSPAPSQPQPLSPAQHNAMAQHQAVTGWCKVHNVEMKLNQGKDGRTWYSHFDEAAGRWCKGK
jgi:hypothetical protein